MVIIKDIYGRQISVFASRRRLFSSKQQGIDINPTDRWILKKLRVRSHGEKLELFGIIIKAQVLQSFRKLVQKV